VLTSVYAVYAIGVLASLLLVGRLSDEVGRRPVLLVALTGLLVSTVLYMAASSVEWLFVARALQGLATGLALGAAGAALLDLRGDPTRAGLVNGVVSAFGIASGALVSSVLVQLAPGPRFTPFALVFVLFAVALAGTLALPESVARRSRPRLRPQWPRVPSGIRASFAVASTGIVATWSIGGLYLALAPQLAERILNTDNHLAGGATIFALGGAGALSQLVCHRLAPRVSMAAGSLVLAAGMGLTALSLSLDSAALFLAASVVGGAGFGVAFMGALRSISVATPADHRAAVMSAFYVVAYLSLSLPAVVAGLAEPSLGLEATFRIFGAAVVGLALVTALGAILIRRDVKPRRAGAGPQRSEPALASPPPRAGECARGSC
jgi:MFS family permease